MSPNEIPGTERETLSALFDGELQPEARRFAMRRLEHDANWKDDCGRWQLIGDVMRRQAPIAAPGDFAGRVGSAVAAEAVATAATVATVAQPVESLAPRRPRARMWTGAALAASLAMLAVFATRSPNTTAPSSQSAVAAATVVHVPQPVANVAAVDAPIPTPAAVEPVPTPADRGNQLPAQLHPSARIAAATPVARRAVRGSIASTAALETAPVLAAATFSPPDATNPFHVPAADPLATRPWPRAALTAGTAFTAKYGTQADSGGATPSFYPFEPRTHADSDVRIEAP